MTAVWVCFGYSILECVVPGKHPIYLHGCAALLLVLRCWLLKLQQPVNVIKDHTIHDTTAKCVTYTKTLTGNQFSLLPLAITVDGPTTN